MASPFPIGDRVGFNLSAPEEVLILEAWRLVEPGVDMTVGGMARFRDRFVNGEEGVEERQVMIINELLATARLPAINRFYPKPSALDEYMKTRGDVKIEMRAKIWAKLNDDAERKRVIAAARKQYAALPVFYENADTRDAFEAALARIHMGDTTRPARLIAPPEPPPVIDFRGIAMEAAGRRGERGTLALERRVAPAVVPGALTVQSIAHDLGLLRQRRREVADRVADAEAALEAARARLKGLTIEVEGLDGEEAALRDRLERAIAEL